MKFDFDWNTRIKIILILAMIIVAPYFAPFAIDFIILFDFMGIEALLVLLFAYSKSVSTVLRVRFAEFLNNLQATAKLVFQLPLFTPRMYIPHAAASSVLAIFACSVFFACVVWVPVMMASAGYVT